MSLNPNRGFIRNQFRDHPVLADGSHRIGFDKTKVYCKKCFDNHLDELREKDEIAVHSHLRDQVRSDADLIALLWSSETNVLPSHVKTMGNHLKFCIYQTQATRAETMAQLSRYSSAPRTRSPSKAPTQRITTRQQVPPGYHMGDDSESGYLGGSGDHQESGATSSISPPTLLPTGVSRRFNPYPQYSSSQPPSMSNTRPSSPNQDVASGRESPVGSSLHPSDSASQSAYLGRRASRSRPPSQLARRSSDKLHASGSFLGIEGEDEPLRPWSVAQKKKYERLLMRLTASAGFPLSWVENPEFHALRETFMPGAPYISRKVLTQRILPTVVSECRDIAKKNVKGAEATMQSDGWTGVNNHHLVAFMISAKKMIQTVDVHNTTAERHTAENYLAEIEVVYEKLKKEWDVLPVGLVTDASC